MRLASQEVTRWKARDGLELEGVLVRPLDGTAKAPLLLMVHGGPESQDRNGWITSYSRPAQLAAAEGYAVLFPNYRGSTGRGVEFAKTSQISIEPRSPDNQRLQIIRRPAKGQHVDFPQSSVVRK